MAAAAADAAAARNPNEIPPFLFNHKLLSPFALSPVSLSLLLARPSNTRGLNLETHTVDKAKLVRERCTYGLCSCSKYPSDVMWELSRTREEWRRGANCKQAGLCVYFNRYNCTFCYGDFQKKKPNNNKHLCSENSTDRDVEPVNPSCFDADLILGGSLLTNSLRQHERAAERAMSFQADVKNEPIHLQVAVLTETHKEDDMNTGKRLFKVSPGGEGIVSGLSFLSHEM